MRFHSHFTLGVLIFAMGLVACDGFGPKKLKVTTHSQEAREAFYQALEQFDQDKPDEAKPFIEKALAADSNFAMAIVLQSRIEATQRMPLLEKALAKKNSEGERKFIEATRHYRKREYDEAVKIFTALSEEFSEDHTVAMALGLARRENGDHEGALAAFQAANRITGGKPWADLMITYATGANHIMKEEYQNARDHYQGLIDQQHYNATPSNLFMALAWTHLYENNLSGFVAVMNELFARYSRNGGAESFPSVWIWNHTARARGEMGEYEEAYRNYETGYQSVPPSKIDSTEKLVWLGRSVMGQAKALAKMGKHKEAWQLAERVKKMIDDGGEPGKLYLPSYHYEAGYLKLEAKQYDAAIEHLLQSSLGNPFNKMLLARAYHRSGDLDEARQAYKEVAENRGNSLDRALSYPEAKKMLAQLGTN